MSFIKKSPSETYKDILYVDNSNSGVDGTARAVKSGSGVDSVVRISSKELALTPSEDTTSTFGVLDSGSNAKFVVDTTNDTVKALGVHVNTQYATFGQSSVELSAYQANIHYAVPIGFRYTTTLYPVEIGTGTDPDTTFTTAEANKERASDIAACLLYLPDAISIDSVTSIEGADTATGDTTRMHLMSYTFTSGSTSCLTSGTLLGHTADISHSGDEQAYLTTWTVDSAAVASGKAILGFFRNDGGSGLDYSVNITVKYHLT